MCIALQNSSDCTLEMDACYFPFKAAFHVPALTLAILVISINVVVILLFERSRNLRKHPSNVIFLSFAINDLVAGFTILFHILPYLHFEIVGCTTQNITKQDLIWWNEKDKLPYNKVYTCILLIAFVLFPFIVLSIQYVSIITLVNNLSKHTPSRQTAGFHKARKALITYSLMFSCFVMLSTPFFIMRIIIVFHSTLFNSISVSVFETIYILRYVTSFINPVLYALRTRDFRKTFKESIVNSFQSSKRNKRNENIMLLDIKT
ncbi:galanin receptor 2b-like [Hydractinia symbiolongicarpus]|uniref:galanin receptor 2b-like n=1 Tax=Hydractinia symbiolongicarpus TaxID=13093 RepID=UPI00254CF0FC|nr:galanin receptor 2b-like [Hydractinia symbiolongicarpus]